MRFLFLLCLFVIHSTRAEERHPVIDIPYKTEKRAERYTYYFKESNWHVTCSGTTLHIRNRSCWLSETNGRKTPYGTYDASGQGPQVLIYIEREGRKHFYIEPGWMIKKQGRMTLIIGDQKFTLKNGSRGGKPSWKGKEAAAIVDAFKRGSVATYRYPGTKHPNINGRTSLMGFSKAWEIATRFVRVDPTN